MIRYFIRKVIQATGKGQELLLGMTIHIFVTHGGIYVHVSPCHLQLVSESEKAENVGTNKVESDF